jgi:Flp pilus assembly protein TadG
MRTYFLNRELKQFARRNEGVTAVEFALIAPVLMMLLMGTIEISLIMYAKTVMEGATFESSRTGKTGYVAENKTQQQTIIDTLNARVGMLMDTSKVTVTSKAYSNFSNIEQPEPFVDTNGNGTRDSNENFTDVNGNGEYDTDMGISGYGNSQQITVYTISYPWTVQTPLMGEFFAGNTVNITARSVVKNEPY